MMVASLYSVVKGFLDEGTRTKVRICGKDYRKVLHEQVELENLPPFLGGTCNKCEHVKGGCTLSNLGPWNDYVVVNKKLKHKDEIEENRVSEYHQLELIENEKEGKELPSTDHISRNATLEPSEFIIFQPDDKLNSSVKINNCSTEKKIGFKIRLTQPLCYVISPTNGVIDPEKHAQILISKMTDTNQAFKASSSTCFFQVHLFYIDIED